MELTEADFEDYTSLDGQEQIMITTKKLPRYMIIRQILKNQEDAELCQKLIKILINHCGETGKNEGAVETLNRIIKDAEKWKDAINDEIEGCSRDRWNQAVQDRNIVERLKKLIDKNTEKECDCEYGGCRHGFADELQKILGEEK